MFSLVVSVPGGQLCEHRRFPQGFPAMVGCPGWSRLLLFAGYSVVHLVVTAAN